MKPSKDEKGKSKGNGEKENENAKKKEEKEPPAPLIPFFSMFRYASQFDRTLMIIGTLAAVANGASMQSVFALCFVFCRSTNVVFFFSLYFFSLNFAYFLDFVHI